jgi:hypothetical protein
MWLSAHAFVARWTMDRANICAFYGRVGATTISGIVSVLPTRAASIRIICTECASDISTSVVLRCCATDINAQKIKTCGHGFIVLSEISRLKRNNINLREFESSHPRQGVGALPERRVTVHSGDMGYTIGLFLSDQPWRNSAASTPACANDDFPTPELPSRIGSLPDAPHAWNYDLNGSRQRVAIRLLKSGRHREPIAVREMGARDQVCQHQAAVSAANTPGSKIRRCRKLRLGIARRSGSRSSFRPGRRNTRTRSPHEPPQSKKRAQRGLPISLKSGA